MDFIRIFAMFAAIFPDLVPGQTLVMFPCQTPASASVGVSQVILRQPVNVGSVLIFMIHEANTHTQS